MATESDNNLPEFRCSWSSHATQTTPPPQKKTHYKSSLCGIVLGSSRLIEFALYVYSVTSLLGPRRRLEMLTSTCIYLEHEQQSTALRKKKYTGWGVLRYIATFWIVVS